MSRMLAERGLDLSHETVRRWVLKFGQCALRAVAMDAWRTAVAAA
jgi:transposase-like protein